MNFCWMCGKMVDLRACKIDEHGVPVHESCYIARISKVQKTSSPTRTAPSVSPTAIPKPEP
jgi:hypothetical protein